VPRPMARHVDERIARFLGIEANSAGVSRRTVRHLARLRHHRLCPRYFEKRECPPRVR